jgi:hypothetical protein
MCSPQLKNDKYCGKFLLQIPIFFELSSHGMGEKVSMFAVGKNALFSPQTPRDFGLCDGKNFLI